MRRLLLLLLGACVALSPSASADEGSRNDADEGGSQMALDVARIEHGHKKRGRSRLLLHTVVFQKPVESENLYQGFGGLMLLFDVDADPADDLALRFMLNPDQSVTSWMYGPGPRTRGFANFWRPNERTVKIEFPVRLLKVRLRSYRWRVLAAQDAPCHPQEPGEPTTDGCLDDTRWLSHKLSG